MEEACIRGLEVSLFGDPTGIEEVIDEPFLQCGFELRSLGGSDRP